MKLVLVQRPLGLVLAPFITLFKDHSFSWPRLGRFTVLNLYLGQNSKTVPPKAVLGASAMVSMEGLMNYEHAHFG